MYKINKQMLATAISLILSVVFITVFFCVIPKIEYIPQTSGSINKLNYEKDEETGEIKKIETVSVIGEDITAIRIDDLGSLGAITKVNYVPNRFVTPTKIPEDTQIVDLTKDFNFAEKGTLFFIIMTLDPLDENFTEKINRLDMYKTGDYWNFTLSLPQIFSSSNIYLNSQLIAENGEIEDYDFIRFNTSYDAITNSYSPKANKTSIDLEFYTRRNTMESFSSARIITIHYQSNGTSLSGIDDLPLIGTEEKIVSADRQALSLSLFAFVLSVIVFSVLTVISILKRTKDFIFELIMCVGILTFFISEYANLSGTSVPLFLAGLNNLSSFVIIGSAVLSVAYNYKKIHVKKILIAIFCTEALLSFIIPFVSFEAAGTISQTATVAKVINLAVLALFAGIYTFDNKKASLVLKPICAVIILVASIGKMFLPPVYLFVCNPIFWMYISVLIANFIIIFLVFFSTERANSYLTKNLNLEVERQLKDINSVITERDNLLRFVSHDMKKPLVSSAILINTLIEREESIEQIKALNIVKQNTDRVLYNLSEVASYARYNYIAEQSTVFGIKELFSSLYKYCYGDCEACGIILKNSANVNYKIFAKRQGLENAITNIVLNAVEHAECTEIELSAKTDKNSIIIEISDNGKGIQPGMEVFGPYISENQSENTGLGLYICKSIVESMNGELSFRCDNGRTIFSVRLLKA